MNHGKEGKLVGKRRNARRWNHSSDQKSIRRSKQKSFPGIPKSLFKVNDIKTELAKISKNYRII